MNSGISLRDELERYYKDAPQRAPGPSHSRRSSKAIKNMVIREAERLRLGTFTFEDARVRDEVDEDQDAVYFGLELQLADGRGLPECQGSAGGIRKSRGGKE